MAKTAAEIDREIEKLKARKQKLLARERDRERKQRNHALIVFGSMVETACGGDWRRIDPQALSAYLAKWSNAIQREALCAERSAEDATADIRAWERMSREEARKDRKMVEEALADFEENPKTYTLDEVEQMIEGEEDPYRPLAIDWAEYGATSPERTPRGFIIWDDDDPDDEGSIYDQYATR